MVASLVTGHFAALSLVIGRFIKKIKTIVANQTWP
jgi:hypothetical protein